MSCAVIVISFPSPARMPRHNAFWPATGCSSSRARVNRWAASRKALYEESPFDANGQPLASTFADYLLPARACRIADNSARDFGRLMSSNDKFASVPGLHHGQLSRFVGPSPQPHCAAYRDTKLTAMAARPKFAGTSR